MEAHFPILRLPLDSWHWNESRSGLRFWFRAPVGPACKNEVKFNSLFRKMWFFLQTTLNIGKLYTVEKNFSSWVWIQGLLPQNKDLFSSEQLAKFTVLHKNVCRRTGHFRQEQRATSWRSSWGELFGAQNRQWKWPENCVSPPFLDDLPRVVHRCQWRWFGSWGATPLTSAPSDPLPPVRVRRQSSGGLDRGWKLMRERKRKGRRLRERDRWSERVRRRGKWEEMARTKARWLSWHSDGARLQGEKIGGRKKREERERGSTVVGPHGRLWLGLLNIFFEILILPQPFLNS